MSFQLHTYIIAIGTGVDEETALAFGPEVARILGDARGWRKYGYIFREVKEGARLVLLLARQEECVARCRGGGGLSCWSPQEEMIIFNETNWRTGALSGLSPERYHNYIVSHEVGHYLGLSHQACPIEECRRRGLALCKASVMQQMTLGIGTAGVTTYMPPGGLSGKPYATLMGAPVIETEWNPTLGTVGDIILADLSKYRLVRKGGVEQASSMHVYFSTGEQAFRAFYRVDGQPMPRAAITPYKGSATVSPFVALATRS
jgi:hypothetical protein